jgi:hypothetical protein
MPGGQFTWASYGGVPTYEKLDPILVSTDLELKFPLALVQDLTREQSDHTPFLLTRVNNILEEPRNNILEETPIQI